MVLILRVHSSAGVRMSPPIRSDIKSSSTFWRLWPLFIFVCGIGADEHTAGIMQVDTPANESRPTPTRRVVVPASSPFDLDALAATWDREHSKASRVAVYSTADPARNTLAP